MSDILKKLESGASDDVVNKSKLKMDRIKNPPMYEDGMGDMFDDFDLMGGGVSSGLDNSEHTMDIGTGMGIGGIHTPNTLDTPSSINPFFNNPMQQPQETAKDPEDEIWDFIKTVIKTIWSGTKKVFKFLTTRTLTQWVHLLSRILIGECVAIGLWLLLIIFGVERILFFRTIKLLVHTLVYTGVTVLAFTFVADYKLKNGDTSSNNDQQSFNNTPDYDDFEIMDDEYEDDYEEFDDVEGGIGYNDTTTSNLADSLDFSDFNSMYDTTNSPNDNDFDSLIQAISENKIGDRSRLYDIYARILPNYTPDFDERKPITEAENSKLFHIINSYCTDAIHATTGRKIEEDDDTYLMEAFQTKSYLLAKMKRIPGVNNTTQIANEVASFFKQDYDDHCYVTVECMGNAYIIKIYTMENFMVSIGDLLKHKDVEKEVKESDMTMPVVLGITDTGKPVVRDFKSLESFIIAGMPRSGKSWVMLEILTQLSMFNSPEDVQFIILDPKGEMSDYKVFDLPHVLCWCGDTKKFLPIMRDLVEREYTARCNQFGTDENTVNIFEYRDKNPEVKIPLIYLVLEEVVSFSQTLTKEEKEEFDALMIKLATKLPASGIRMLLVPHVTKHQFLNKTVTDVIPFRASVKGDEEHIKSTLGIKNFPRTLLNKGDMALKIDTEPACYIKAPVISHSNTTNKDIYNRIKRIWDAQGYEKHISPALLRVYELDGTIRR